MKGAAFVFFCFAGFGKGKLHDSLFVSVLLQFMIQSFDFIILVFTLLTEFSYFLLIFLFHLLHFFGIFLKIILSQSCDKRSFFRAPSPLCTSPDKLSNVCRRSLITRHLSLPYPLLPSVTVLPSTRPQGRLVRQPINTNPINHVLLSLV